MTALCGSLNSPQLLPTFSLCNQKGLRFSMIPKIELLAEDSFSGSSDAANCENSEDSLSCYFITPKTPANTLKSDSILTF